MKLTLVRHGQTIGNVKKMTEGHLPGKLSALGKRQAQAVGERLKKEKFDIIYCSDLKRTKDTLKPLLKYHTAAPVIYDEQVRERHYGILEGKPRDDANYNRYPGTRFSRRPTKGESILDVRARAKKFLDYIQKNHPTEAVLVVSHSGFIRQMHSIISKIGLVKSYKSLVFNNTSISEFSFIRGKWKVLTVNDHAHL